jgi:hypothetical protein
MNARAAPLVISLLAAQAAFAQPSEHRVHCEIAVSVPPSDELCSAADGASKSAFGRPRCYEIVRKAEAAVCVNAGPFILTAGRAYPMIAIAVEETSRGSWRVETRFIGADANHLVGNEGFTETNAWDLIGPRIDRIVGMLRERVRTSLEHDEAFGRSILRGLFANAPAKGAIALRACSQTQCAILPWELGAWLRESNFDVEGTDRRTHPATGTGVCSQTHHVTQRPSIEVRFGQDTAPEAGEVIVRLRDYRLAKSTCTERAAGNASLRRRRP